MPTVYLSLGSNIGDREGALRCALERLHSHRLHITAVSSIYETEPIGETQEPVPAYLNCAARAETDLNPQYLLEHTQAVERACGREPSFRWGPRALDIDILTYDNLVDESTVLTLPHPRMAERAFVLIPLAEIAPSLTLPDGKAIQERLADPSIQLQVVRRIHRSDLRTGEEKSMSEG